ncbi:MAG TPA: SDR family oxidoreductase [Lentisphaeria bacterium]|nr:MAG: hypothetical protein A2X47_11955 [Lentisphaerae bacterium GWF2_38_69]HBM16692.1 SDR family oxidoreductase [Lentisphaeria bacterium]
MSNIRNIVLTGASSGIGRALAEIYSAPGVILGLLGRVDSELEKTAVNCRTKGAEAIKASIDITDHLKMKEYLECFDVRYPIDMLIANAGIDFVLKADYQLESMDTARKLMEVNFFGVLNTINPVIESMKKRRKGHIVILSSVAAFRGLPVCPVYCASKSAVKVYGEALRCILSPYNIKVSIVCPGFVETRMSDEFPYEKPFMISADKAALIIKKGLISEKAYITFSLFWKVWSYLVRYLPYRLSDKIVNLK